MTFADLLTTLETRGALHASRVKDMKTSLRYLAAALGQSSLEQCPVDAACQQEATWLSALETHYATLEAKGRTIGAVTRRNTRNNLRTIFRLAEASGLLAAPLPPLLLRSRGRQDFERQQWATAPYRTTYRRQGGPCDYALPQAKWPPDIAQGWRDYRAKCGLRLRETTLKTYENNMALYLGYIAHIVGRLPTWNDWFDVEQLAAFVRWHGARVGRPVSAQGHHVVVIVAAIANVIAHSQARAVADLRQTLKKPATLHIKRHHMVSLAELEAVAEACFTEGRAPYTTDAHVRHPGGQRAIVFQRGVMLKLLVRAPLRQRNLRELRLDQHLYKDHAGHWQLHLRGDDLKISLRQGRLNEYKLNLSEDAPAFVPVLEEFLQVFRPRLPGAATSPLLFLTRGGKQYRSQGLRRELAYVVSRLTGQRFYPHLIRTIWATEYLTQDDAPDWTTAAVMLGDKVATVMAHYHDLVDQPHHAKAKAFLDKKLRTG